MSEPAETMHRFKAAAPAGAAALAIVVAVVGGTMALRKPADAPTSLPASSLPAASLPAESPAPVASPAAVAPEPITDEPITGGPIAGQTDNPGPGLPGVAFDQSGASTKPALGVEIVVKFKEDRKIQGVLDAFWKDAASARKKFDAFKSGRPEFAGVKLDRVTPSNELVLTPSGNLSANAARDLANKIGRAPDVSYAEPNVTAKPGAR